LYSATTLDHLHRPRNAGDLDAADGTADVSNPACGDTLRFSIRLDAGGRVVAARFRAFGCGGAIAAASLATEWVAGKALDELLRVEASEIDAALGGLPRGKGHCADLARDGIRAAARAAAKKAKESE
jgi:nitrogen fixation NifU-like protein